MKPSDGKFRPPAMTLPGYSSFYSRKGKNSTTGVTLDPTQQGLRDSYTGLINTGFGMMNTQPTNYNGFGAISPEMYNEFVLSNTAEDPTAFYDQAGFDSMLQGNLGLAQSANKTAQGLLDAGPQAGMSKWLDLLRQMSADQENSLLQGNFDKQFMKGILQSTAGADQTSGITEGIRKADLQRQLESYGLSQDEINQALSRAQSTSGVYTGMEADAAGRMFNVNNTIANRMNERFGRASNLFGMGMNQQNVDFQRGATMAGMGQGFLSAQDAQIQNMINSMFGAGAMQSNAANAAMANKIQQQAASGSMLNSLIGAAGQMGAGYLGNTSAVTSDRRLKTNIEQIGTTPAGYPWYKFDYVWGTPGEGVMADEVPAEWVSYGADGFAAVDYSKVQ